MVKKIIIAFSILIIVGFLAIVGWCILIFDAFGGFDKDYSVTELKENLEKNKKEVLELKHYYDAIVPKDKIVEIEFTSDDEINILSIKALDSVNSKYKYVNREHNLNIYSMKMDSILNYLGWAKETIKTIKQKIDAADCIGIENGEPARIGFKRSSLGIYLFDVFDKPIQGDKVNLYNDSCTYIMVDKHFVLEYRGGAVGNQCFYNFK